jgi:hypothetical protein
MKQQPTPLVDEYLESIKGMQQVQTDDFFYSRLEAKMSNRQTGQYNSFQPKSKLFLKPAWAIAVLVLLLGVNGYMLSKQLRSSTQTETSASSLQEFAQSYDQTISSYQ